MTDTRTVFIYVCGHYGYSGRAGAKVGVSFNPRGRVSGIGRMYGTRGFSLFNQMAMPDRKTALSLECYIRNSFRRRGGLEFLDATPEEVWAMIETEMAAFNESAAA